MADKKNTKKNQLEKTAKDLTKRVIDFDWNNAFALARTAVDKLQINPWIKGAIITPLDYLMAVNKGNFKNKLFNDVKKAIEEGKVKAGVLDDDLNKMAFTRVAEYIDEKNPDIDMYKAMRSLFFAVADAKQTKKYEIAQDMLILQQLDSVELNILKTCYKVRKKHAGFAQNTDSVDTWRRKIVELMRWDENMIHHIILKENHLMELELLDRKPGRDDSMIRKSPNFRLTGLAIKICDLLTRKGYTPVG